jgi:hypothetical protein
MEKEKEVRATTQRRDDGRLVARNTGHRSRQDFKRYRVPNIVASSRRCANL